MFSDSFNCRYLSRKKKNNQKTGFHYKEIIRNNAFWNNKHLFKIQARQRKKTVTVAFLQGLGSVCMEDRKGGKKENLWEIKAVALVRCHCASNFKNPFGNHGSCIAVITETPASPTYYRKHSNSYHVSKKCATQTVGPVLQGGADWRGSWGAERSATCIGLMRPAAPSGPRAVPCQTFQENRSSLRKRHFGLNLTTVAHKQKQRQNPALMCTRADP